ncbi:MFS transporter [Serratia sp. JSRIV001]|uniref:MFS transporter n=1 Tax=Serratia sp. JSRIV001 TaxID=2831893 RepID=UPI001CBD417E|nr:MFS transporter [Serratia sp. JSRIV001]UAN48369.1 MFS transporter [Serratia sp. JSRIV001]
MKTDAPNVLSLSPSALRGGLISLALPTLLSSLGSSITNVSLPTLAQVFGASFQDVQWVVIAYLLAITTLIVGVGRLGDIISRRKLLLAGLGLFMLASLGCAVAPTIWWLIAARVAQGLGGAVMMAITLALVGETISKDKVGRAMGLLGTLSAVGTALGPTLGGVLIAGFGWQSIFLINLPLGGVALFCVYRYLPQTDPQQVTKQRSFDFVGMALLGLTLALFSLAMTLGHDHFGSLNSLLLGTAVAASTFVWVERKVASPLVQLALLRQPILSSGLLTNMLVSAVIMTSFVVGPFYLAHGLGLAPQQVGLVMSAGPLIAALAGVPSGYLVDRFGAPRMISLGLLGVCLGALTLSMVSPTQGVLGYISPICLITAGYALFQAANNTAVIKQVGIERRGVASGLLNLARNLGFIIGASAMGGIFALASATSDIRLGSAVGLQLTYLVAAILAGLGLLMALWSQFYHRGQPVTQG